MEQGDLIIKTHNCLKIKGGEKMKKLVKKVPAKKRLVSFYYCENTNNCNGK